MNIYTFFVITYNIIDGYNNLPVLTYERYNIKENKWEVIGEVKNPKSKFGISLGPNGNIYFIGGKIKVI